MAPPAFRLSAKYIFITLSQSQDVPHAYFHQWLQAFENVSKVYSCREPHEEEGEHHHAIIKGAKKWNIRNPRFFDFEYGERTWHPSFEAVRNLEDSNRYIAKDGRTLGDPIVGTRAGRKDDYRRILQESTDGTSFMGLVREVDPVNYVINHQRLEYFAAARFPQAIRYGTRYERSSFSNVPEELDTWVSTQLFNGPERPKALVIIGEPGWGKTKWAQSLGVPFEYWMRYLTSKRTEGARYAILDDFDDIKRTEFKGFWGSQNPIGVKVSNGVSGHKQWNWGIPTIWLFNECPDYLYDTSSYEYKRSVIVRLNRPLF